MCWEFDTEVRRVNVVSGNVKWLAHHCLESKFDFTVNIMKHKNENIHYWCANHIFKFLAKEDVLSKNILCIHKSKLPETNRNNNQMIVLHTTFIKGRDSVKTKPTLTFLEAVWLIKTCLQPQNIASDVCHCATFILHTTFTGKGKSAQKMRISNQKFYHSPWIYLTTYEVLTDEKL